MHQPDDKTPHFHARRHVLLGITALAALSACGGGARTATVTDRQIGAAPGVSLHLRELATLARQGVRAVQLYCVNLTGIEAVRSHLYRCVHFRSKTRLP